MLQHLPTASQKTVIHVEKNTMKVPYVQSGERNPFASAQVLKIIPIIDILPRLQAGEDVSKPFSRFAFFPSLSGNPVFSTHFAEISLTVTGHILLSNF